MGLTTGIVGYWKFDSNINDSVGSNNLTNYGATNGSTYGIINGGYLYDGTNDYMEFASNPIDGLSAFTINVWAKTSNASDSMFIFSLGENAESSLIYFQYRGSTDFRFGTYIHDYDVSIDVRDGVWHMFTMTWDGTNLKCYIDAVQKVSTTNNIQTSTANDFKLISKYGSGYFVDGYIDEYGVWNRELSSTEVSDLYNSGSGLQYPFGESTGWSGKILGITPAKIIGISTTSIAKINGVS